MFALTIDSYIVLSLHYLIDVISRLLSLELDTEIINHQSEGDWAPEVTPQSWCKLAGLVFCAPHTLDKELVGNLVLLWEAIYFLLNSDINIPVFCNLSEVIFLHDPLRDDVHRKAHEFRLRKRQS